MTNYNKTVIPAISGMKEFEKFISSDKKICVIMNIHVGMLDEMIRIAHKNNKIAIVHLDLIKGITPDEFGCEFICQILNADGIISTKPKALETAKKNSRIAILRLFLIDSKSLEHGIDVVNKTKPDYVEILPGIACQVLPMIKEKTGAKLMCGGLIHTKEDAARCFEAGACAITVSNWRDM